MKRRPPSLGCYCDVNQYQASRVDKAVSTHLGSWVRYLIPATVNAIATDLLQVYIQRESSQGSRVVNVGPPVPSLLLSMRTLLTERPTFSVLVHMGPNAGLLAT